MNAKPPLRKPQVRPLRGAVREAPTEPEREEEATPEAEDDVARRTSERMRFKGHVALSREARNEAALDLAERRRKRRLIKAVEDHTLPPVAIPRGLPIRIYISMRWFSAAIVIILSIVLYLFLSRDVFFIHEIFVGGTHYLTPPEIFERSGLANIHIFWVDPAEVEARLEQDPSIANAVVEVGWPPNMIQITITEREPALVWEQAGQRVWVDVTGRVMSLRRDLPALVRVIVEKPFNIPQSGNCPLMGLDRVLGAGTCIDQNIVSGALQFKARYPNVTEIVYDPTKGLGYHDGRGWVLWFGDGSDIDVKMAVYNQIVGHLQQAGKQPIEINVSNPDSAYYSVIQTKR